MYRQTSNIRHQIPKLKCILTRLAVVFAQFIEVENKNVVGAVPTGDAPTTSEWSTILLPSKVHFILKVWGYTSICETNFKYKKAPYLVIVDISLWHDVSLHPQFVPEEYDAFFLQVLKHLEKYTDKHSTERSHLTHFITVLITAP